MAKKAKKKASAEDVAAKRAARREALKNRPAGQRTNSKQIDVIELENGCKVKTFGYPVVAKRVHVGVLTTTVVEDAKGNAISVASEFIPGNFTVKAKKGHGVITAPKVKGEPTDAPEDADEDDSDEDED